MKKIVRQQNYLKELIESQGNRFLTRQALSCLIRSVVEPLLDAPETGVVFYRIEQKEGLLGLLKRLEFSSVEALSFADNSQNLREKVWANTEFICVLTHRYVSIIIWDNNTGDSNTVRYYSLYNSKLQCEPLDIIKRNSNVDISQYQEKFNPDRRDNVLLNASIRRLLDNMDEAVADAVLGYAEKSAEVLSGNDYIQKKSRLIAHEIRNQLSICDLYTEIINRQLDNGDIDSVKNSLKSINKAIKMANNSLISLKISDNVELQGMSLRELLDNAVELSKVYLEGKDVQLSVENNDGDAFVLCHEETLLAVIINLVKNASEAFNVLEENGSSLEDDKYIKIKFEKFDGQVQITISNNAPGIREPEKIFNEGYTTKKSGSGLGLWICKKFIENMRGVISLSRYAEDFTEFLIQLEEV